MSARQIRNFFRWPRSGGTRQKAREGRKSCGGGGPCKPWPHRPGSAGFHYSPGVAKEAKRLWARVSIPVLPDLLCLCVPLPS